MEKKAKKSRLSGIPAWALSLMTFFASIVLFELLELLAKLPIPDSWGGFDYELIIVVLIYAIFLTTACFFICKTHPKSVWYTPLICNGFIIFVLIMDQSYWIDLGSIIAVSIIGAIAGARIGQRRIDQAS